MEAADGEGLEKLARYILRNPFSVAKMRLTGPDGTVFYQSRMNPKAEENHPSAIGNLPSRIGNRVVRWGAVAPAGPPKPNAYPLTDAHDVLALARELVHVGLPMIKPFLLFAIAAAAEIFGCYAVYGWLKLGRSGWWLVPGALSLVLFAWLLTLHLPVGAGRIYAAYGGVYVAASLAWLWLAEGMRPDRWDVVGSSLCIVGTVVILLGPRWQ